MSEDLLSSVKILLGSSKNSRRQINDILSILILGSQLFPSQESQPSKLPTDLISSETKKKTELQKMNKQERILKIIELFTNEFETKSLPNNSSVKNYLTFLLVVFKLAKKLKPGYHRSLVLANTLSRLNKMLVSHPLDYNKRTTREPLGLLFLITESAIEATRNLKIPYVIDDATFAQFLPLMTRFSMNSNDPLQEIVKTITDMPKFRITTTIGEEQKKIIGSALQHCFPNIPLKIRIGTGTRLLNKITSEQNDSTVLSHYNTLKLFVEKDIEIRTILSKLAKVEITKTKYRRFVNGILEELASASTRT